MADQNTECVLRDENRTKTKTDSICDVKQQQKHCDITFGLCRQVALSSSAVVNENLPLTVHLNELNPNIHIMVVDKDTHFFRKNLLHYNENPASDITLI